MTSPSPSKSYETRSIHISASHHAICSLISLFLKKTEEVYTFSNSGQGPEILMDEYIHDFGCKYRLVGRHSHSTLKKNSPLSNEKKVSDITIVMHVRIPGWDCLKMTSLKSLRNIFGKDSILETYISKKESITLPDESESNLNFVSPGYHFAIKMELSRLPADLSIESWSKKLSKIRTTVFGCQLEEGFLRISEHLSGRGKEQDSDYIKLCRIPMQRPTKRGYGGDCIICNYPERVTVVLVVDYDDEIDRALAKLFMRQFSQSRRSSSANSPFCDYWRGCEPPREIEELYTSKSMGDIAGFLSFTFLIDHVRSQGKREKAVNLITSFFPFIDNQIKSSKSILHARMREKLPPSDIL